MKYHNIIKTVFLGLMTLGMAAGCAREPFEEITELSLKRCLEPLNLRTKTNSKLGDVVTFSWDVNKDAESYTLEAYKDEAMTELDFTEEIKPDQVPYDKTLAPDLTLYCRLKANSSKRESSVWAVFPSKVETFAVKDNLFLEVTAKTKNSVTLSWSKDVKDYKEVDHIEYGAPGAKERKSYQLSEAEIDAAGATVSGEGENALEPGKEYELILFYKTARRGQVNVWTNVDPAEMTEVSSVAALQNALATEGAKIYLKLEGSPYLIKTQSVSKPVSIYGESAADGTQPIIQGELEFRAPLTKGSWLFQDVTFDGVEETYGFLIQLDKAKKDFAEASAQFENITFRNCYITSFSKGLIYEWDQTYDAGELTFDSCYMVNINTNMNGGDVMDLRKASKFGKISFVNNTIFGGGRTWLRVDANPSIESFVFENNTVNATGFAYNEGSYSMGFFGFQSVPGSFVFRNNLLLNMPADSRFGSDKANYKYAGDLGLTAADNYYYNVPATYFSDNYAPSKLGLKKLNVDPCYNSKGGYFNLDPDSEIAGRGIGASRWWTPYVEKEEDLTLNALTGSKTWNFADAALFTEKIKREMVRDGLYINASDNYVFSAAEGVLGFGQASSVNKKNLPLEGYLAFKVNTPGSVLVKVSDPEGKGAHILVGAGPADRSSVAIKGGASALTDLNSVQKILLRGITEESLVYVWADGPVSLENLAWSTDVTPVNTALAAPAPVAEPEKVAARESTPVVLTWEAVPGAGSYTVIFSGKSYEVEEPTYTIPGGTVSMLDPGSYKVEVYANPSVEDIYNTESAPGVAAFAVLSAGGEEGGSLVVKTVEELNNALLAGKSEITLAPGTYDLGLRDADADGNPDGSPVLKVTAPLSLTGQDGAVILGGFKLSGEVGTFSLKNLKVDAKASALDGETIKAEVAQSNFIDLDNGEGVKADAVLVENVEIRNFAKSVIYASNTADKFDIAKIQFKGLEVYDMGTGQGVFDLRNGKYGTFTLEESTVVGGRDFFRLDAAATVQEVYIRRNTLYNLNDSANAGGVFCLRINAGNEPKAYVVSYNMIASVKKSISGRTAAVKPAMARNAWFDIGEPFYTGCIDADLALANNGFNLAENPFKDAENGDFTLVSALAQSCGVGAPKWNPAAYVTPSESFTVKDTTELYSAIDAGRLDLILSKGEYELKRTFVLMPGMRLKGESGTKVLFTEFGVEGGDMGTIVLEGIDFVQTKDNNFINVGVAMNADKIIIRNCSIDHVKKSVFYGNAAGNVGSLVLSNVLMTGLQAGQGTIDIRNGVYETVTVEDCTVIGGRDFARIDAAHVTGSVVFRNNLFDGCCIGSGNGILYVRSTPQNYKVYNNLFLNETGSNAPLGKASGVTVPDFNNNWFYNCTATNFWNAAFTQELGTTGGGVLDASPVTGDGDYTLTNEDLKKADVGPARWNPSSGQLRARRNRR